MGDCSFGMGGFGDRPAEALLFAQPRGAGRLERGGWIHLGVRSKGSFSGGVDGSPPWFGHPHRLIHPAGSARAPVARTGPLREGGPPEVICVSVTGDGCTLRPGVHEDMIAWLIRASWVTRWATCAPPSVGWGPLYTSRRRHVLKCFCTLSCCTAYRPWTPVTAQGTLGRERFLPSIGVVQSACRPCGQTVLPVFLGMSGGGQLRIALSSID